MEAVEAEEEEEASAALFLPCSSARWALATSSRLFISSSMEPCADGSSSCWNHFCSSTSNSTAVTAVIVAARASFLIKARSPK